MATKSGKSNRKTTPVTTDDGVIRQRKKAAPRLNLKCTQCGKPFSISGMSPNANPANLPAYRRLCKTCQEGRTPGQSGYRRGRQVWTRSSAETLSTIVPLK